MHIGIPIAQFHLGNTGEYVQRALSSLGHSVTLLSLQEFFQAHNQKQQQFDYFFCVDSGEPFNFLDPMIRSNPLTNVCFWFIDFRHNKNCATRTPTDLENAVELHQRGGLIFQAQDEDAQWCRERGLSRSNWLPLAADPEIWNSGFEAEKKFSVAFVGNVWDRTRQDVLKSISEIHGTRFGFKGHGKVWRESAAQLLHASLLGFNISYDFGKDYAYDINMRVFETLSCGIPLITNEVPNLWKLFPREASFLRTYQSLPQISPALATGLQDYLFLDSGQEARRYILENHTYAHRMKVALDIIEKYRTEVQ